MRELKVKEFSIDAEGNESITVISNHRFIYRGYLQIACCDLTRNAHPCLWLITWDPTQPVATRPLAIQKDGTWFCYGWDLTKNICEVFGQNGYIRTAYSYTPYGSVTANGDITQPIQWSSEYADTELALVYYNYRHYNPMDGRWSGRDLVKEYRQSLSRYSYTDNNSVWRIDNLGNSWFSDVIDWVVEEVSHVVKVIMDTFNKI
ncbi:MAG: RHS repeat-associated core domain-containing protein [Akkermansia sp.]|nr:RHS repeat-associated core domain-containing protein [Akkermansia sp.]